MTTNNIITHPCPFCGERDDLSNDGHFIRCDICGATGPERFPSPNHNEVIKLWNIRAKEFKGV